MKKSNSLIAYGTAFLMMAVSCSNGKTSGSGDSDAEFATDSVAVADSLTIGSNDAKATIAGMYPHEGQGALGDSVRAWLAKVMEESTAFSPDAPAAGVAAPTADGMTLITACRDSAMAMMRGNLTDLVESGFTDISMSNEIDITFGPTYQSDRLLTYYLTSYAYMGGAHGGTMAYNATFDKSNGEILTYDKIFLPESRQALIDMIKGGLWTQYFCPEGDDSIHDLSEALLIDPNSLELPAMLPAFGPEGVAFTYGQYEIAPYAAGMPSCILSYDSLRPFMRPDVAALLPDSAGR